MTAETTERRDDGSGEGPIVLFDGHCSICCGGVHFMLKRDAAGRIRYGAMQTPAGRELLRRNGRSPDDLSSFVVLDRGEVLLRSAAVLRLTRYLRFPWPLFAAGWIVPRPLRDWLYDLMADNRFRLRPRRDSCYLPTPEERARFI